MSKYTLGILVEPDNLKLGIVKNGHQIVYDKSLNLNNSNEDAELKESVKSIISEYFAEDNLDKIYIGSRNPQKDRETFIWLKHVLESFNVQIIEVPYFEALSLSAFLDSGDTSKTEYTPDFPLLALLVSSHNTEIILVENENTFNILASTSDLTIGEAFAEGEKILGIGKGGFEDVSSLGDELNFKIPEFHNPDDKLDFRFQRLLDYVKKEHEQKDIEKGQYSNALNSELNTYWQQDMAAAFQEAAIDYLLLHFFAASVKYSINNLTVAGSFLNNKRFQDKLIRFASDNNLNLKLPPIDLTEANGMMIGTRGYYLL